MNLAQFASTIGLSASTVSRALNGYADVSAETRRRVEEAAERLGYRASAVGRRLRTGRAEAIGFLLAPPRGASVNFFQLEMLAGIDEALRATDYHLVVITAKSEQDEFDCLRRMVEQRQVEAVLLCRTRRTDERIIWLLRRHYPFAAVGRSETPEPFPFLDIDHAASARMACERLIGLGHRRIALVNTPAALMYSAHARQGYEQALLAAGLRRSRGFVVHAEMTEAAGQAAAHEVLARPAPPTALICGDDVLALGALRAVAEANGAVAVIGCGDIPMARYATPPLTTFRAPFRAAGQRVTELLMQSLAGKPAAELQEVWTPELVVRASDLAEFA
jgi:LacI family transcriptional regulator